MGEIISSVKSRLKGIRNRFRQKARALEGQKTLDQMISDGLPETLRTGLSRIISGEVPNDAKAAFGRVEGIRDQIAARGDEEIPIYYSPKPTEPGANERDAIKPGEIKTFTCEHLAKNTSVPADVGQMMHLIGRDAKAQSFLELGSCVGIGASYLASVPSCRRMVSIEGSTELSKIASNSALQVFKQAEMHNALFEDALDDLLPSFNQDLDFAWIDGHHEQQATLHYFARIKPHLRDGAIVAFDDIYWSSDMLAAWDKLRQTDGFAHAINVGICGIGIWGDEKSVPRQWDLSEFVRSGSWQAQKPAGWKQD